MSLDLHLFIQQDLGYGMTFVYSAGLRLRNDICSCSRTKVME